MYDFNRCSERLMHTDFEDFSGNLRKFVGFIDEHQITHQIIDSAGTAPLDIESEVKAVNSGHATFEFGSNEDEEIATIFAVLCYMVEKNISYRSGIFQSYCRGSNKYQDMVDNFNERVTYVLINDIEARLTKLGYELGLDDKVEITNNFSGATITNFGLQQGHHNEMSMHSESNVDYAKIETILSEILQYQNSFSEAFGEKEDQFSAALAELSDAVSNRKGRKIIGKLIETVMAVATGATGNLISDGIVALLSGVVC